MRHSRRHFLMQSGLGMAAATQAFQPVHTAARRPNILLIVTDDQGWGDVRSHGNDLIVTPHMDALAAGGARFDRFYVSPVCAPTRASLLTGRYHMRTGVSGVTHRLETMRSDEVTIAEILREAGYATGCFGKWHNGAHYPNHPNGQGFEEFFGFCAGHWNNYFDTTLQHNGVPVATEGYINDVITDAAIGFMEAHRDNPFLCYVPYNTPHSPFQVPDSYFNEAKQRIDDDELACVYAMCKNLDDNLGRMIKTLDELGLTDDTIVLFFGDNGPNTDRYNGGMLGRKGSVHEGGVRNAFFMRYPRRIDPGTEVTEIAAHIDLLPTLAELTGATIPDSVVIDGRSFVPLLDGRTDDWPDRKLFFHWRGRGSVRTQQYRLFTQNDRVELYAMITDPRQEQDIASDRPEVTDELKTAYDAWYADVTKNGREPPPADVGHPEMPIVTLPAPEAQLAGGVQFKGEKGWANDWITNWTSTGAAATWDINVTRQGTYEIAILYTCPEGDTGAAVRVSMGDQYVDGIIDEAHDPDPVPSPDRVERKEVYEKTWNELILGAAQLPEGEMPLQVRATAIPGNAAMDLKGVRVRFVVSS